MACAKVEDLDALQMVHGFDGFEMTLGQINYMDVISDAGSIGCVVIIAEYMNLLQLAGSDLCYVRKQVVGNALGKLPSLMLKVFSGMTGSEYFISPLESV